MSTICKCPICQREMNEWGECNLNHHMHLLVTKSLIDGTLHVHGDLENKDAMKELIAGAQSEIGVEQPKQGELNRKEIVFKNRQRIGDMLTFTSGIRDFKNAFPDIRINVIGTAMHIFDHNPYLDRSLAGTTENIVEIGPGSLTNKSNSLDWHMTNAFRISMEEKLKVSIPQGISRPDIWLTREEWDAPRVIQDPYWIISTTGEKGWGCKMYPHHKWQEVVDQNPDLLFVQIGTAEDNAPRLKGKNVIDYIGKTQSRENGIRDLFKLFLNAEGSIGLVSFHMHLSGALYKPAVVIAGAREPVSFTRYPGHAYLSNDGMLPCAVKACWHCAIDACKNLVIREESLEKKIPKCADIIESEDVTRAIRGFYKGGRLTLGQVSEKPKLFKNIVATPPKLETTEASVEQPTKKSNFYTYGMEFGGGALTERDWEFISAAIKEHKIKNVVEFGAGLSTLLLQDLGLRMITFETHPGWIKKIKELKPKANIELWDGQELKNVPYSSLLCDLCFVDGPAGDKGRDKSTQFAAEYARVVIVHDAGREWARVYQKEYLEPYFDGPIKGGHRCHMWIRKDVPAMAKVRVSDIEKTAEPVFTHSSEGHGGGQTVSAPKDQKFIKIVTTAKGWGGQARSVSTIMKFLVNAGHRVQFIPFRNAIGSKEWQELLKGELKAVDVALGYGPVKEACDVLLMYADDYVWEFKTPEVSDVFSEINAEKKVMMLNYRRGDVGKLPWTQNWDQYLFLCSMQEQELLKVYPGATGKTKVLPPCTILEPFLAVKPDYRGGIRIVRHNSQGDTKFVNPQFDATKCTQEIQAVLNCRPDLSITMMPGPSFFPVGGKFNRAPKTPDPVGIAKFLSTGNLFWYSLPYGYTDMGPRVILEAMASGLPCLVDDWSGGAVDRISSQTGWALPDKNWIPVLQGVGPQTLERMGEAAKERAYNEFRPEKWVGVLLS